MGDVLMAFLVVSVVIVAVAVATGGWFLTSLRRRNRVSTRDRTRPPLPWLVSPGQCARLHRRLRDAITALRTALPRSSRRHKPPAELAELARAADELEAHAAGLDRDLLLAAHFRGAHGAVLRARLVRQVADVERMAARIAAAATAADPGRATARPTPETLAELDEQLDALEAARDELARLEARAGLTATGTVPLGSPRRLPTAP